ncbi:2-octaprenyl-6-methoxyphenol hydroxylase [Chitinivorax tropicus]|uniref:2-octaprenyl-6-methoxyphenol hydroxylase n=1 Tax=Chitinivorax tropicus TaxID=714531 RepID=A0A840MQ91_9PROT|nr:FAD-dependent monooxygenase [Chitinivorax tropicus]MBB5019237.1 2-octaprenyl-6-methoxyphenol hydroxylase [Chitinivorax tropicus]
MTNQIAQLPDHLDIAIVGGGPVGAALALSLQDAGLHVAVLEARAGEPKPDPRALALSWGSVQTLERLGAWQGLQESTPIKTVHVSQRSGFGHATLSCEELDVPALGYVVNYGDLAGALHRRLLQAPVHYQQGVQLDTVKALPGYVAMRLNQGHKQKMVTASLLVVADGGKSLTTLPGIERRMQDYGQHAVICDVRTDQAQRWVAYERFSEQGPMALLPRGEGFTVVWTCGNDEVEACMALSDEVFLAQLQGRMGDRAGRFISTGPRASFPLALRRLVSPVGVRTVLIGNAAQVLHPVAGQGFNLGLRDAIALADVVASTARDTLGTQPMLNRYAKVRKLDATTTTAFTDSLIKLFALPGSLASSARGSGLALLDLVPAARKRFTQHMVFGAGA